MNSSIALGVQPLQIPSQADGMHKALALEALMGRNDLQRQQLANAPAEQAAAARQAALKNRSDELGNAGKEQDIMSSLAASVAYAPPDQQPIIYPQMAAEWKRLGLPGSEKVPDQWSPEFLPHLTQVAARAQGVDKQQESANYRALAGPQGAPAPMGAPMPPGASPTLAALSAPAVDATSGALTNVPGHAADITASPQASPIGTEPMPPQIPPTGPVPIAAPPVAPTAKRPGITPDDLRKEAARMQGLGTKQGFDQAKIFLDEADRLDNRIWKEREQTGKLIEVADETSPSGTRLVKESEALGKPGSKKFGANSISLFAPQPGVDAQGNSVFFQPDKKGGAPQIVPGVTPKAPEGYNKQKAGVDSVLQSMGAYKDMLTTHGDRLDRLNPKKRLDLGTMYNDMMLQAKEAYNLGVLNGPDFEILQEVIKNPLTLESGIYSAEDLKKQVETFEGVMGRVRKSIDASYGQKSQPEAESPKRRESDKNPPKTIKWDDLK